MTTHTELIRTAVPGGLVTADRTEYDTGRTTWCVGFVTLGPDGDATRDSVVSRHDDETHCLRAQARLVEHFAHVTLRSMAIPS